MTRKILLRFDDICPTMDWNQWARAVEILERYNVKPLLGVIPDCQDPDLMIDKTREDFWEYISSLRSRGYAIAMHGYHHVYDSNVHGIVNRTPRSEFSGHTYEKQREKLHAGKKIMAQKGIDTDIFFAPAHSYDVNTLYALSDTGFHYMSDGKSCKAIMYGELKCLPCRSGGVPRILGSGYFTAVFHAHEWTRPDKKTGYDALLRLCERHGEDIVDFETYKNQPIGNKMIQQADEKLYILGEYNVKPVLRPVKRCGVRLKEYLFKEKRE